MGKGQGNVHHPEGKHGMGDIVANIDGSVE